jgi:hypothetical protein
VEEKIMAAEIEGTLAAVDAEDTVPWCEEELSGVDFGDKRLEWRVVDIANKLAAQPTASINQACEDWADTRAAYRLFANEKVTAEKILEPSQQRTRERMKGQGLVLAVQDTTFLDYTRHTKTRGLGPIGTQQQNLKGLVMHSTLAFSPEGMPLGLLAQEIWARSEEEEQLTEQERKSRPIEEKESYKWLKALEETVDLSPEGVKVVTICDREGDIYELFVEAQEAGAGLLVRAAQNRAVMDAETGLLWDKVASAAPVRYLKVQVPARGKEPGREAVVSVRFRSVTLKPPWRPKGPDKDPLLPVPLDAVLVQEVEPPAEVTPLEWLLLTNAHVHSAEDAVERVRWYRQRWPIEVFHKVLKSGCKVEDCRLGKGERLIPYLALSSIIAWRLYWLTHINRHFPDAPCITILAEHEWQALYATIHRTSTPPKEMPTVRQAVHWIAQLGGFLGRKGDGEPGPTVIWRGWQRLNDIAATWLLLHPAPAPGTCG